MLTFCPESSEASVCGGESLPGTETWRLEDFNQSTDDVIKWKRDGQECFNYSSISSITVMIDKDWCQDNDWSEPGTKVRSRRPPSMLEATRQNPFVLQPDYKIAPQQSWKSLTLSLVSAGVLATIQYTDYKNTKIQNYESIKYKTLAQGGIWVLADLCWLQTLGSPVLLWNTNSTVIYQNARCHAKLQSHLWLQAFKNFK